MFLSIYLTSFYHINNRKKIISRYNETLIISDLIKDNIPKQLNNDHSELNNVWCYYGVGDSLQLKTILNGRSKLFLYGGNSYCNSCIDYHLSYINKLGEIIGNDNIVLLFKQVTPRELTMIKNDNKLNVIVVSTNSDLSLPIEKNSTPCFFALSPDLKVYNTFYPIKEKSDYNDIYYRYIVERIKYD